MYHICLYEDVLGNFEDTALLTSECCCWPPNITYCSSVDLHIFNSMSF